MPPPTIDIARPRSTTGTASFTSICTPMRSPTAPKPPAMWKAMRARTAVLRPIAAAIAAVTTVAAANSHSGPNRWANRPTGSADATAPRPVAASTIVTKV